MESYGPKHGIYPIDPTGRQNFGDTPGQIPKLILTLCLKDSCQLHQDGQL